MSTRERVTVAAREDLQTYGPFECLPNRCCDERHCCGLLWTELVAVDVGCVVHIFDNETIEAGLGELSRLDHSIINELIDRILGSGCPRGGADMDHANEASAFTKKVGTGAIWSGVGHIA
ncbi:MAG: hypothetical protein Phyf2KO_04290 [Phycisphaerales bacterium]